MLNKKRYRFTLVSVAPVYIGSGKKYFKTEYFFRDGKFYFPDMFALYKVIQQKGNRELNDFEDFLAQAGYYKNNRETLGDFINKHDICIDGIPIREVDAVDLNVKRYEVHEFMKNAYGASYVPGSSLKGALRTMIVSTLNLDDASNSKYIKKLFSNIRVSDSNEIPGNQLVIVPKNDLNKEKDEPNQLPIFRESIKPMTKITFEITCSANDSDEQDNAIQLMDQLVNISIKHYEEMKITFYNKFKRHINLMQKNAKNWGVLYLGGGTGWVHKTLFKNKKVLEEIQNRFARGKMRMKDVGTMKLTKYKVTQKNSSFLKQRVTMGDIAYFEMGRCIFKMEEIDNER